MVGRSTGGGGPIQTALGRSIAFARVANYASVLVGTIGGARWGRDQIEEASVRHHGDLVGRLAAVAEGLAEGWQGAGT